MSLTIIEINDSEIRTSVDSEIISRNPGYAVLHPDRIETGVKAWDIARIKPRETSNKYWSQLNQDSLIIPSQLARHNADLAYNQLMAIHEHAGKPDEIIFAVPGCYNRDQLALLLGIVEACPFTAIGLVDTAIASTSVIAGAGHYNHLDIHLHYTIVTSIDVSDQVTRKSVKVIDEVGIAEIYDTCAEYFSDLFIDQSRFDPLHHAETEQILYSQIHSCLSTLKLIDETSLEIQYKDKRYLAKVSSKLLLDKLKKLYEKIYKEIDDKKITLISDRLDNLPGFSAPLNNSILIDEKSVFRGCSLNLDHIQTNETSLSFITTLPTTNAPTRPTEKQIPIVDKPVVDTKPQPNVQAITPTHILVNNKAYAINAQIKYISGHGDITNSGDENTQFSIVIDNNMAKINAENENAVYVNSNRISVSQILNTGDLISIAGSEPSIKCIEVF